MLKRLYQMTKNF